MNPRATSDGGIARSAGRIGLGTALAWGAAVGVALSTQLLFQPFLWRHYGWDEMLDGWVVLAGERLAVTLAIACALAAAARIATPPQARHPLLWRAVLLGTAILVGALVGEAVLLSTDPRAAAPHLSAVLTRVGQWAMLSGSISSLWYLWRRSSADRQAAQAAELHRIATERQLMQARLQALRSQIEPHFLFNTLATVRRLHRTEPPQGTQLLAHFLDYLRSALPERTGERQTLGQEIDLVQAYLGVVAVRMAGRLTLVFDVPAALRAAEFPALTVATLVENAIKHGVGPLPQGGEIAVRARLDAGQLEVVVADTGAGFDVNAIAGSGIGLANIRWRLAALYGERGSLVLDANTPSGVRDDAAAHLGSDFMRPWRCAAEAYRHALRAGESPGHGIGAPGRGASLLRCAVYGTLWGTAISLGEALALPLELAGAGRAQVGLITMIFVDWCIVGTWLAWLALRLEPVLDAHWRLALAVLLAALVTAALAEVKWFALLALGIELEGYRRLGAPAPSWGNFCYVLWMTLFHGGLFLVACVLLRRAECNQRLLGSAQIARRRTEALLDEAELDALGGRVDPAFLLRAMAAVQARYARDALAADRLLDQLVAFLRGAMPVVRSGSSTLKTEVALARHYAALNAALDGGRTLWRVHLDGSLPDVAFPPLLLLPLMDHLGTGRGKSADGPRGACLGVASDANRIEIVVESGPRAAEATEVAAALPYRLQVALRRTFGDAWSVEPACTATPGAVGLRLLIARVSVPAVQAPGRAALPAIDLAAP